MSTSPAQTSSPTSTPEPLSRLLAAIEEARALPAPEPYEQPGENPLDGLTALIRAESERQATTPPAEWPQGSGPEPQAPGPKPQAPSQAAGPEPQASSPTPHDASTEARVGREILAVLRNQPLDGSARAAAVELLAAQIDEPDPAALREILGILVTGRAG